MRLILFMVNHDQHVAQIVNTCVCRGGKYSEEDAKAIMVQILRVTAYCHLQGVVHRDLKPEVYNLLFHFLFYFILLL